MSVSAPAAPPEAGPGAAEAGRLDAGEVLARLGTSRDGLSAAEAARRLAAVGPNVLRSGGAGPLPVLLRQLTNPLLILLVAAAATSIAVGERLDAVIVLVIVTMSAGLGFLDEWRSEQAVAALRARIRHVAATRRDGAGSTIDVRELVPGDVVTVGVGDIVPADLRLLEVHALECDEAVLTGEAEPAAKSAEPSPPSDATLDVPSCAFMGTVVHGGAGTGVVVATGRATAVGRIAERLGERHDETVFQQGLRHFSGLLVQVTAVLSVAIFVINAALRRPVLESALFALAIAVGLTPQLLPAIVTVSLSRGARRLTRRSVVVKRLVTIEDLGNVEVLYTDKTGTLTEGHLGFVAALDAAGSPCDEVLRLGMLVTAGATQGAANSLDEALLAAPAAASARRDDDTIVDLLPFDHDRRMTSALVQTGAGRVVAVKGAPESVLARCVQVADRSRAVLDGLFADGRRVVAVAVRDAGGLDRLDASAERGLSLQGFLVFEDPPKAGVADALERLHGLGVEVRVITGDNGAVARRLCTDVGLEVRGVVAGAELDAMDDDAARAALATTTVFSRIAPEQKARIIRLERSLGSDVAYLGDGVNDAVALHAADVGISVEGASDVAKDAADVVLLGKDLDVLADSVVEGRRIFANTIKYVLMATSSNFGNMFSAAGASLFLDFLPMLPTQVLLNNLLYDMSEMTIPGDRVDEEMLRRPAHWDIAQIRSFMAVFGPISSVFDVVTFVIMLRVFHAGPDLFRSGWFAESLATQTLVIFVIRTRRVPFLRSRPATPLLVATVACALTGAALPFSPVAGMLGFTALPVPFLGLLAGMVAVYLGLVELGKAVFYRRAARRAPPARGRPKAEHRLRRSVGRWPHGHGGPAAAPTGPRPSSQRAVR